ncbi:MAG: IS1182 family transposase [Chloroflexi bacterium]|nr:IS1182 family transposase [Chloroflexota bacterium]
MSLNPQQTPVVPEETAMVARAAFPKGNTYMRMRDELGPVFADEQFVKLFPDRGQPAESPARLALVTVMQFAEGLSDRQAADAVRARIDWKYALGLEIADPGFDASVLSEFRTRLIEGSAELLLFETMLACLRDKGLLKVRGRMRTDSTHILAAIRSLSRLECIGETIRQALNVLATVVPDWLSEWVPADWYDRYNRRFEDYRLPKSKEDRYTLGEQIGRDGMQLWQRLGNHPELAQLRNLPAMETLRQVWLQQFMIQDEQLKWRPASDLPPASLLINSPYDVEARFSKKRKTEWTGYKVHLSKSCDEELPHLIVNVETTAATTTDYEMTPEIHGHLAERDLLPGEHLLDKGYMSADNLVDSQEQRIDLIGPVAEDPSWQAQAGEGFASAAFVIDWEKKQATCPQGHPSHQWSLLKQKNTTVYNFRFHKKHCDNCLVRGKCTKSATSTRSLTIQPQAGYEALRAARQRQKKEAFWQQYAKRAGVEGTISQGIAIADLRHARYIGLAKTHLQHILTALGMNILRLGDWWSGTPQAQTRISPFARLKPSLAAA